MKLLLALSVLSALCVAPLSAAESTKAATPNTKVEQPSAELQAQYAALTPPQKGRLTKLINHGDAKAIEALPGIGAVRAKAVIAGRPYENALDLLRIEGVAETTIKEIIAYARTVQSEAKGSEK